MRGEGWLEPADVRFGVALPDAWGDFVAPGAWDAAEAFAASAGPGGTVELPLGAVLGGGDGAAAAAARTFASRTFARVLPAGADLCIRLGPDFVGPALGGSAGTAIGAASDAAERAASVEAAYLRAVAACRSTAEDPAVKGRVAACLLEFPKSIHYGPAARRHLGRVLRDLAGLPLAVAFYGADWYSVRVVEGLKERGAALCLLALPPGPASLPSIDVATAPLVYVKIWDAGPPEAWMPRLEALALSAERLRVLVAAESSAAEDLLAAADHAAALRRVWALTTASPGKGP
jgi:hypothetical protein